SPAITTLLSRRTTITVVERILSFILQLYSIGTILEHPCELPSVSRKHAPSSESRCERAHRGFPDAQGPPAQSGASRRAARAPRASRERTVEPRVSLPSPRRRSPRSRSFPRRPPAPQGARTPPPWAHFARVKLRPAIRPHDAPASRGP